MEQLLRMSGQQTVQEVERVDLERVLAARAVDKPVLVGSVLEVGTGQDAHIAVAVQDHLVQLGLGLNRAELYFELQLLHLAQSFHAGLVDNHGLLGRFAELELALVRVVYLEGQADELESHDELYGVGVGQRLWQAVPMGGAEEKKIAKAPDEREDGHIPAKKFKILKTFLPLTGQSLTMTTYLGWMK